MNKPWLFWIGLFTRMAAYCAIAYAVYWYVASDILNKPLATVTLGEVGSCIAATAIVFGLYRAFDADPPEEAYHRWGKFGIATIAVFSIVCIVVWGDRKNKEREQQAQAEKIRVQTERLQARDALASGLMKKGREASQ